MSLQTIIYPIFGYKVFGHCRSDWQGTKNVWLNKTLQDSMAQCLNSVYTKQNGNPVFSGKSQLERVKFGK